MSEQLHVHRAADWFESELQPVPRDEWDEHASALPDLVPSGEGGYRWVDHPAGTPVELAWQDGRIVVDNLDGPTRVRLARLAEGLGCVLQGDDCEVYGADGDALVDLEADAVMRAYRTTTHEPEDALDRIWDPARPTSRGEFLRGLLRRD